MNYEFFCVTWSTSALSQKPHSPNERGAWTPVIVYPVSEYKETKDQPSRTLEGSSPRQSSTIEKFAQHHR